MQIIKFFALTCLVLPIHVVFAQDIPQRVTELEKKVAALEATVQKLVAVVEEQTVPAGTIVAFGGPKSQIPTGWLHCDGEDYEISKYPKLAEALAKSWGVNTSGTKFFVPDLRGQFLRGWDETADIDPDKMARTSKNGGKGGNNVGSYQEDATAVPNRELILKAEKAGNHVHSWGGTGWGQGDGYDNGHGRVDANNPKNKWPTSPEGEHEHKIRIVGGGDAETRPTNACVIYIIKAE
jgi:Phage Tail Collar Domain